MNRFLLEIVACPACNGRLFYDKKRQALICKSDVRAYPLRDGIPVLLESEARNIRGEETNFS